MSDLDIYSSTQQIIVDPFTQAVSTILAGPAGPPGPPGEGSVVWSDIAADALASNAEAIAGTNDTKAVTPQGLTFHRRGKVLALRDYFADGADITAEFEDMVADAASTKKVLDVGGGQWVYDGTAAAFPTGEYVAICGDIAGKSRITVNSDGYLFAASGQIGALHVADVEIVGGKGFLNQSYTSGDASAGVMRSFERAKFVNHTECAININSSDSPNWQFRNCYFATTENDGTMHFAHAGLANGTLFDGCDFGTAQVGVKLLAANDVKFRDSSWYQTASKGTNPRIMLWLVPMTDSLFGQLLTVTGCKFGNENWANSDDYKIVIADEGSGSDVGTTFPDLTSASTGRIYGMYIVGNKAAWTSTGTGPLIYSTTDDIGRMSSVFANTYIGSGSETQNDINVVEFASALSLDPVTEEFISLKSPEAAAGFARVSVGGSGVETATTGWQPPANDLVIPAVALSANVGSPALAVANSAQYMAFDASAAESAVGSIMIPPGWRKADLYVRGFNAGAGSGAVRLRLDHRVETDTNSLATAMTGGTPVDHSAVAQNIIDSVLVASDVAVVAGRRLRVNVVRLGNHANDSLGNDWGVLEVVVRRKG